MVNLNLYDQNIYKRIHAQAKEVNPNVSITFTKLMRCHNLALLPATFLMIIWEKPGIFLRQSQMTGR